MNYPLRIGVSRAGGLGDNLNTSAYIAGIKRAFPQSKVTVFVSRHPEVFRGNQCIDGVVQFDTPVFESMVKKVREDFDIFFEIRYATYIWFSDRALQVKQVQEFKKQWEKKYPKYRHIFDRFLYDIPAMERFGKPHYEITTDSANIQATVDDMFIDLRPQDYKAVLKYRGLRYITVNNSAYGGSQTKCWTPQGWNEVIRYLRALGFYVIQVGTKEDAPLNAHERFNGTIFETAVLLKGAWFHMGIEGGLIHVAKTVGIDSVVLFGPTPIKTFGYENNVNVRSKVCKPCWWRKTNWFTFCKLTGEHIQAGCGALCMTGLKPEVVFKAVDTMVKRKGFKMAVPPSFDMSDAQLVAAVKAQEQEILKKVKGTPMEFFEQEAMVLPLDASVGYASPSQIKRVHAILDMVGTGHKVLDIAGGDGYISSLIKAQGNTVTLTDISEIRLLRAKFLNKLDTNLCRAEKLPFPDESFDVVVCAEVLEHCPNMWVPLREAERVVKKTGKLIITIPVGRQHDKYEHHLKKIEMANIEDDMLVLGVSNIKAHYDKFMEFNHLLEK